MLYRRLGNTGLSVSELGLGCASFWGKKIFAESEAIRLVHEAAAHGVTFFDTGSSYSGGNAEPRLGRAIASLPNKHDLVIATKAGSRVGLFGRLYKDFYPAHVRQSVEDSLKRLGLDAIPVLQLHGPSLPHLTDELLSLLIRLKEEGKVRHLSVNTFDDTVIRHCVTLPLFEVMMIDYNMLRPERKTLIAELARNGFGILAGMALGSGVFVKKPTKTLGLRDLWYAARTIKNHRHDLCRSRHFSFLNEDDAESMSAGQIALAYVLQNPNVSCAVFGTTRLSNLLDNLGASGLGLSDDLNQKIAKAAERVA